MRRPPPGSGAYGGWREGCPSWILDICPIGSRKGHIFSEMRGSGGRQDRRWWSGCQTRWQVLSPRGKASWLELVWGMEGEDGGWGFGGGFHCNLVDQKLPAERHLPSWAGKQARAELTSLRRLFPLSPSPPIHSLDKPPLRQLQRCAMPLQFRRRHSSRQLLAGPRTRTAQSMIKRRRQCDASARSQLNHW